MAAQKQDDQLERTFSSYVRIQAVVLKTYLGRWTIGRSGERGSGISVLPARYDDDDIHSLKIIDHWEHEICLCLVIYKVIKPLIQLKHIFLQKVLFTFISCGPVEKLANNIYKNVYKDFGHPGPSTDVQYEFKYLQKWNKYELLLYNIGHGFSVCS